MKRKSNYIEQMTQLEKAIKHEIGQRKSEMDRLLKRYDLDKIDLEAEYAKIQRKESYLSAKKREIVVVVVEARRFHNQVSEMIDFDLEMHTASGGEQCSATLEHGNATEAAGGEKGPDA